MIIEKISIKSFGLLRDTDLVFSKSINIIEGENESGKSTVAAFIKYMLYGFGTEGDRDLLGERRRRINWETNNAQGSMTVRVGDKRYLITRSTVPVEANGHTSYKEEATIIDLESGTPAFGKMAAGEVFFGIDKELFENTAFVGQIGDAKINEGSVKQSIENILFSGSERLNTQRAMDKVQGKMEVLLHKSGAGGTIYDLSHRQADLEERLEASMADNREILAKESDLYNIKGKRDDALKQQENLLDLDNCYKNVMLIQSFDKLHELEEEAEKKGEAYNAFIRDNAKDGFTPTEDYLNDISISRQGVNDSYVALEDADAAYAKEKSAAGITNEIEASIRLADEMGGEKTVLAKAKSAYRAGINFLTLAILSLLGVLAAVVYELVAVGAAATLPLRVAVGVAGALALAACGYTAYLAAKAKGELGLIKAQLSTETYHDLKTKLAVIGEARAKRDAMISSTESARQRLEAAKTDFAAAKVNLANIVSKWSDGPKESSVNEFLDNYEAQIREFLEYKRILLEDKSNSDITVREIRRTLSEKSEVDIRAQVSPLKRKALASINHDEIINGIATCRAQVAEQDRLSFTVENELASLKIRSRDPAEIYTKIASLDESITELTERHKAYYLAYKTLEGATDNLRAEISPRLGEFSANLMGIMTDKKYSDIDVSDGLKVSFTTPGGEKKSVDFLSGGTQDIAYIAVRMALIDMLYKETPPVCFDESFAHQDNVRARSMMKALAHLAEENYQSFVFTCRGREAALAKELLPTSEVFRLSVTNGDFT